MSPFFLRAEYLEPRKQEDSGGRYCPPKDRTNRTRAILTRTKNKRKLSG
jgi:hypothetical protein